MYERYYAIDPTIPYCRHISNVEVRAVSVFLQHANRELRLRFFGYVARTTSNEDHHRALATDWKQPQEDITTHGSEPLNLIQLSPSHAWKKASS